jgi:hypothetical protein
MHSLAVVAMTEILHHWLAGELYLHRPARTLNCGSHDRFRMSGKGRMTPGHGKQMA